MALPVLNFASITPTGDPTYANMLSSIGQGMQLSMMPSQLYNDQQKQRLANEYQRLVNQNAPQLLGAQAELASQQAQYYPQMTQAQMNLTNAQARREFKMGDLPFGGATLPGMAGQMLGLESIKMMYGEGSPQYQRALQMYNLEMAKTASQANYQNVLARTAGYRFLTPMGKSIVEQSNLNAGTMPTGQQWGQAPFLSDISFINYDPNSGMMTNQNMGGMGAMPGMQPNGAYVPPTIPAGTPGGMTPFLANEQNQPVAVDNNGIPLNAPIPDVPANLQSNPNSRSIPKDLKNNPVDVGGRDIRTLAPPEDLKELSNQYDLQRLKLFSDPKAREKAWYAINIDKTLAQINPEDLLQYSGIIGKGQELGEKILSGFGKTSENFKNYQKSLNNSNLLATQVRQFYGDSIQPTMIERLELLTNPSTWYRSPDLAKELFEGTKRVLEMETGTYREALSTKDVYKKPTENSQYTPFEQQFTISPEGIKKLQESGIAVPKNGPTQQEIAETAKLYGISEQEVINRLKKSGLFK